MIENQTVQWISWLAAVLCTLASGACAKTVSSRSPRIFAGAVLFTMSWAVLVPYYDYKDPNPIFLLPVYNGILLTFAGSILFRESISSSNTAALIWASRLEYISFILMLFIVDPGNLFADFVPITNPDIANKIVDSWVESLITVCGDLFIWIGLVSIVNTSYARNFIAWVLGILLVAYSSSDVWFSVTTTFSAIYSPAQMAVHLAKDPTMEVNQAIAFAFCKCSLTTIFIIIVGWQDAFLPNSIFSIHTRPFAWLIQRFVLKFKPQ
jgi:hypothetical protein